MPENEGQVPTDPTPGQEPTTHADPSAAPATTDPVPKGLEALTVAELAAMVKQLRSESASHRTKLTAFERAEDERKQANLSALEKAQQAAQAALDARGALEAKLAKRDALSALKNAGIIDPDLAYLAIKEQIKIEDGEPINVDDLVRDFVTARPQMVASVVPQAPDTKSTNPTPASAKSSPGRNPGRL